MSDYIGKLTKERAEELRQDDEMIEFVVHPTFIPTLVRWLDTMDADLVQGPPDVDSKIKWFIFSPRSLGAS